MPIIKPKNHLVIDMYKAWCAKKLKEDTDLSLVYDTCYKAHGLKVLYKGRVKRSNRVVKQGEMVMSYNLFRTIIEAYNLEAIKLVIEGETLELGNRMGKIFAKTRGRNFNRRRLDFEATAKARQIEPNHPDIFHTSEDYCRISWKKGKYIQNESIYIFVVSSTFKTAFKSALRSNPLLKHIYPFSPYIPPVKQTA